MANLRVVVADRSEAIFFDVRKRHSIPVEIDRIRNPTAHEPERELRTDRPGRAFESVGAARHAVDFASDRRSVEANKFARRIARRLDIGRRRKEFDRIHLIAGPGFLGILRRALSPATTALVIQEAAKNLVGLSEEKRSALLRRLV